MCELTHRLIIRKLLYCGVIVTLVWALNSKAELQAPDNSNIANLTIEEVEVIEVIEEIEEVKEANIIPKTLINIGFCESGNRQFNKDGSVLRGKVNPKDVGKYQINEKYHLAKSIELEMDIYTEQGNEEYAMWLYQREGSTPWNWSRPCWSKL